MNGMVKSRRNLRPLWDSLIEVYKVFASICDRHNLRYCADAGTALGAVRHKGFIPWDDDLDIQMPRPDYDRFVEIAKAELPKGYAWLDRWNCRDFKYGFGKVIVTDEMVVDRVSRESGYVLGQGIFIDIFPLDGYPESKLGVWWRRFQNYLISVRGVYIGGFSECRTPRAQKAWLIGALISPFNYKFKSGGEIVNFWEKRAKKIAFGATKQCVSIGLSTYSDDKPYPLEFLGNTKEVPFDNVKIRVQEHVEDYLKVMFGDYMQLPPENQRCSSHSLSRIMSWRLGPEVGNAQ